MALKTAERRRKYILKGQEPIFDLNPETLKNFKK